MAVVIATLSGQTTALAANSSSHHGHGSATSSKSTGSTTTTTSTLPTVPAAAEPLLEQLLATAGLVTTDNEQAAALSERYDEEQAQLTDARTKVLVLDERASAARARLHEAALRLRAAAIRAYVTGEVTSVNSSLLGDTASQGQMALVYAGVATSQLRSAEHRYGELWHTITTSRDEAATTERQIQSGLEQVAALRKRAEQLMQQAATRYASTSRLLLAIVGPKEFARLFSPWPKGALYKGPNLAGTSVGKVANVLQGLAAVGAAKKFVGVPYVWGGAGRKGVDCSGLTMLAWQAAGITLAHSATLQWEESEPVPLNHLEPGDLLFYHFAHDGNTPITHVVMYAGGGPYGAATVIQASSPGTDVGYTSIYFEGLVGAGRP